MQRRMLVQTLNEQLRMCVQSPRGFLCFNGGETRIHTTKDASFGSGAASKQILTSSDVLGMITTRTIFANVHPKQKAIRQQQQHAKPVSRGQRVLSQNLFPFLEGGHPRQELLKRQGSVGIAIFLEFEMWIRALSKPHRPALSVRQVHGV